MPQEQQRNHEEVAQHDWRAEAIKKLLPPDITLAIDGDGVYHLETAQETFHIREKGSIEAVQAFMFVPSAEGEYSMTWVPTTAVRPTLHPWEPLPLLKYTLSSIELINDSNQTSMSIREILATLDPRLKDLEFFHVFGEKSNAASESEITFAFPTKITDIFTLFHEIGHHLDGTPSEVKFKGGMPADYAFSKQTASGENILLSETVARERTAWAIAYRLLKKLRELGLVYFTNDELRTYAMNCLATYEAQYTNTKGNVSHRTHFTNPERARERKKERNQTTLERISRRLRSVFAPFL